MAVNLARSFLVWNDASEIKFYIVTDLMTTLPSDLTDIQVLRYDSDVLGKGFSSKLRLDQFTQSPRTLFIDADCLCVGPLDSVFDRFEGRDVSVVGDKITHGEWFGNISALLAGFGLSHMPKFNGGIYYLEKSTIATSVYEKARELEKDYDMLGMVRLRGKPNDELLMALAMGIHGLASLADDGTIMGDLYSCPELRSVDVLRGLSCLKNPPPPDKNHRTWYPVGIINPKVVHFLGDFTSGWQYRAESKKLELVFRWHFPCWLAEFLIFWSFTLRARLQNTCKSRFRPLYHRFFGFRKVSSSPRI
jgi:hypothetical protein